MASDRWESVVRFFHTRSRFAIDREAVFLGVSAVNVAMGMDSKPFESETVGRYP